MDFEIRDRSVNQGRRRLTEERRIYLQLVQQGVSRVEACRIVGINYRTGKRWRNGRAPSGRTVGASPIPAVAPSGPSRYLREADRIPIADRLREKATIRQIATELGRSPSTISREIRRNGTVDPRGARHYRPHAAQTRAESRRPRPKPGKIAQNLHLRAFIQEHLDLRWSPEQICQALSTRPSTSRAEASYAVSSPRSGSGSARDPHDRSQAPVRPSTSSRTTSRWPLWRDVSSMRWRITQRRSTWRPSLMGRLAVEFSSWSDTRRR